MMVRLTTLLVGLGVARAPMPWTPSPCRVSREECDTARDELSSALSDNTVVIFSRLACKASQKVKTYFEDAGIPFYALELDGRADGEALRCAPIFFRRSVHRDFSHGHVSLACAHRGALAEKTGSEKTPAVYIRGKLVSTFDVKQASLSGELTHWSDRDTTPKDET